jgi:hypothetical protein
VKSAPDRQMMRRLDQIERRVSRTNWTVLASALLLSGVLFYVNGETTLAIAFWAVAFIFFLLNLFYR